MEATQFATVAIGLSGGVSLTSIIAAIYTYGQTTQKLKDHTESDERRFAEVSQMLTEIRGDVKDILKRS